MSTIKIGSSKDKKGITVNPSTVLFNGNNVKHIMCASNYLWTNNPLIPTLTGYNGSNGVVSASEEFSSAWRAWYAFDDNPDTLGWLPGDQHSGWLMYKFNEPKQVIKIKVSFSKRYAPSDVPLYFEGSNDNSTWITLKEFNTNISNQGEHSISNKNYYTHYRLRAGMLSQNASGYCGIAELQMYGH